MKMTEHEGVVSVEHTEISNGVLYKIALTKGRPSLNVFYSDAKQFGPAEYLARPHEIGRGDMILIQPLSRLQGDVDKLSSNDGILIATHEEFLRAINYRDIAKSEPQWRFRKT
jgi:hypothetical protein